MSGSEESMGVENPTEEKPRFTGITRIPVEHSTDTGYDPEAEKIVEQLGGRPLVAVLAREITDGIKKMTLALSTILHLH